MISLSNLLQFLQPNMDQCQGHGAEIIKWHAERYLVPSWSKISLLSCPDFLIFFPLKVCPFFFWIASQPFFAHSSHPRYIGHKVQWTSQSSVFYSHTLVTRTNWTHGKYLPPNMERWKRHSTLILTLYKLNLGPYRSEHKLPYRFEKEKKKDGFCLALDMNRL